MELLKNLSFQTMLVICLCMVSRAQVADLMQQISKLAFGVYEQCAQLKPTSNIIISPIPVASSLALLTQASNGHLFSDKDDITNELAEYHKLLQEDISFITMVNQIYMQQGYRFRKDFRIADFSSGVKVLNFSYPNKCSRTVNRFIEKKTNHTIKDLIQPKMFDKKTGIVLVNAIRLKSSWLHGFNRDCTYRGQFYIDKNASVPVEFMCFNSRFNKQFDYNVLDDLDATAVGLRYKQTNYSFVIILPNKRMGLADLESKLKNHNHDLITFSRQQYAHVNVVMLIPKFKIEFEIELNGILKNLGMGAFNLFDDETNLTRLPKVLHKAFIEFDDNGTETVSSAQSGSAPHEFRADHPFLFFLVDRKYDSIIFSGRVQNFPNIEERDPV